MKLMDLTVEMSGNDIEARRTLKIGPLKNGLNFVYGEKGSGKTTLRHVVSELLLDSATQNPLNRKSIGCQSISMVLEHGGSSFQISRDSFGVRSTVRLNSVVSGLTSSNYTADSFANEGYLQQQIPALEPELVNNTAIVGFRDVKPKLKRLHEVLQSKFDVPVGEEASYEATSDLRDQQYRIELQNRIDVLQLEIDKLLARRASFTSGIANSIQAQEFARDELQSRIEALKIQLASQDPEKLRIEIASLQNEEARIRSEIESARKISTHEGSQQKYLITLYRLLDEIDQQFRETRIIQSNVQRHRVKLKEEMQQLGELTIDEQHHPYHSVREILRRIESHVNYADDRGDQWADDYSTGDNRQFSRFLDETCQNIREDLSLLCEELSNRYRDSRNRAATSELKELRHNYNFVSECAQEIRNRRDRVIEEIQSVDFIGAETINRAEVDYCRFAAEHGHWEARQKFLGSFRDEPISIGLKELSPNTLQQQQLQSIECRLTALQHSLTDSVSQAERTRSEILELNRQLQATQTKPQYDVEIAQVDAKVSMLRGELQPLKLKLHHALARVEKSHPLLVTAGNILQHLTRGDLNRVWLATERKAVRVATRDGNRIDADTLAERGLAQLVQLSLVLAASESSTVAELPLVFDDLFADLAKERTDSVIQTLHRWCQETVRQVILLTQHRFLADRIPEAPVWEIENVKNVNSWQPATHETMQRAQLAAPADLQSALLLDHEISHPDHPVAEYPQGTWPRPYPLSKYPRTTDRQRNESYSGLDVADQDPWLQDLDSLPEQSSRNSIVPERTSSVSPAEFVDPVTISSVDENTLIDSIAMFDNAQLRALADFGIATIADFLNLDSSQTSAELAACYLSGESLHRLQSAVWLLVCVPGLSVSDSQALVACGISEPEHLLTSNAESLFQRLARFLRSPDGRQFVVPGRTLTAPMVQSWQNRLRDGGNDHHRQRSRRDRRIWESDSRPSLRAYSPRERSAERESRKRDSENFDRQPSRNYQPRPDRSRPPRPIRSPRMRTPQSDKTHADERTSTERDRTRRAVPRVEPARSRNSRSDSGRKPDAVRHAVTTRSAGKASESSGNETGNGKSSGSEKLRFYLELTDHIEAAPSIGPKTAERFEAIGVVTISDFLKMTAEALSEKLDYKRLNAKLLRQWQHQARLVCRIPNLRGHDAQLLVGCEIIEAEEIASMRPEALFDLIGPFSDTKEGMKIIRNGKKPDLNEVTDWIRFAQHNRSLRAA